MAIIGIRTPELLEAHGANSGCPVYLSTDEAGFCYAPNIDYLPSLVCRGMTMESNSAYMHPTCIDCPIRNVPTGISRVEYLETISRKQVGTGG